jgi:hypothetical protein
MKRSEKLIYGITGLSSLFAVLCAMLPARPAHAQTTCNGCQYAGTCYSQGACISSPAGGGQQCSMGVWSQGCY